MTKVLVVDDSSTMRRIIVRALNAIGVSAVSEAGNGNEALACLGKDQFTLVLTDWNMPEKNGLELVKDIRGAGNKVPVIMITTEAEKAHVLEAIKAGVSDYLLKPFTSDLLKEKLDRFI